MKQGPPAVVFAALVAAGLAVVQPARLAAAETTRPNVLLLIADDQRWDKVTSRYMPNVWDLGHAASSAALGGHEDAVGRAFRNSFVPNPLCCPSRAAILTGEYSQTNGVWNNNPPYGGWEAFKASEPDTIATDFQANGYRTAMIGKYLNGYVPSRDTAVPPGWDKWFASKSGAYYDYWITTTTGGHRFYGHQPRDYVTRVFNAQAQAFVANSVAAGQPFFLYYSFTAPHGPAIPDPRDVGRFAGERDLSFQTKSGRPSSSLESAYSMDRAVGQIIRSVPDDTIVVYIGDNGLMWGERRLVPVDGGFAEERLRGKQWPYNESIRVPLAYATLDGTHIPQAGRDDLVLNVDVRESLLNAAGIASRHEGINWFDPAYVARDSFSLQHVEDPKSVERVPTYCGVRSLGYMYARFKGGQELFYASPAEHPADLLSSPSGSESAEYEALKAYAQSTCNPPDGYSW
jgi:N-acetylglucosamine-6-sulfatase